MPRVKSQKQSLGRSRSPPKREDNKVPQVAMHRCDHPGCSFWSLSRGNLKTHTKIHTQTKDQICSWPCPERADGKCSFSCTDPSSLNRHVKRHIKRAIGKGQNIPEEFLVPRTRNKNPSSNPFNRDPYPSRHIDSGPEESSSAPFTSSSSGTHTPCIYENPTETPDTQSSSNVGHFCVDALSFSTWPLSQAIIESP